MTQTEGAQYYYSQYNPSYQGYQTRASYNAIKTEQPNNYKTFYDQSTND